MAATLELQALEGQLQLAGEVFPPVVLCPTELTSVDEAVAWVAQHQSAIETLLSGAGAILLRGFALQDAHDFDAFSGAFGYPGFTYQESLSNAVRINYTERVFTANEAPPEVEIYLHHEMAQTPLSPDKLFFYCQSAAQTGGATPICRSDCLYRALLRADPALADQFETLGLKYTTRMPAEDDHESGQGRSWRSTLSVDSKPEAEAKLASLGYGWVWSENDALHATTPVLPAVKQLNNGKKVFYNQLVAAYMGWPGVRENPGLALKFGDDSDIPVAALELIASLCEEFTFDIPWQDGDVALIDNKMTMHGRRPYSGDRKRQVLVALA
ncbi:MAG: SyrP protein [Gammaproteobacteria bacterium]|nr:SyrP protein [Gammaproteobacteria bacterium]